MKTIRYEVYYKFASGHLSGVFGTESWATIQDKLWILTDGDLTKVKVLEVWITEAKKKPPPRQ